MPEILEKNNWRAPLCLQPKERNMRQAHIQSSIGQCGILSRTNDTGGTHVSAILWVFVRREDTPMGFPILAVLLRANCQIKRSHVQQ